MTSWRHKGPQARAALSCCVSRSREWHRAVSVSFLHRAREAQASGDAEQSAMFFRHAKCHALCPAVGVAESRERYL
jgi:hypothetical protein